MDNFIIEIDCKKIIEWLSERKKLHKDWPNQLKAAQLQAESTIKNNIDIKYPEVQSYIEKNKSEFNFSHINHVCELLLKTDEAKQKNLIGRYTSKLLNEWLSLRELYRKKNLHIADLAKIIRQNIQFEIPAVRSNNQLVDKQVQDTNNKIQDNRSNIKLSEKDYRTSCDKYGIEGVNLKTEVPQMICELPQLFGEFVGQVQSEQTKKILQYYYDFVSYSNGKKSIDQFEIIEYLLKNNDDLIEVYKLHQKKQNISEELKLKNSKRYDNYEKLKQNNQVNMDLQIQWDIETHDNQIDSSASNQINWDDLITIEPQPQEEYEIKQETEIDWDIIVKEDQQTGSSGQEEDTSIQETILSTRETRNEIITNLFEILFFLKQRISDQQNFTSNSLLQAYDQGATNDLFEISADTLNQYHSHIEKLIEFLSNYKIRQFFILHEQPKAQERIIEQLSQNTQNIAKQESNILNLQKKQQELQTMQDENREKLKSFINQSLELKTISEQLVKTIFSKEVKITGEINSLR